MLEYARETEDDKLTATAVSILNYQTAWTMLHRYRTAMVRGGRERLSGTVEVNETFLGGPRSGKPGRGALGKAIVAVAVEQHQPKGFGRCRLAVIPNVKGPTLRTFLLANMEPGSTIISDGYGSYPGATLADYVHRPVNVSGSGLAPHIVVPGVHRVASLVKRWLLGTHQGAVEADHLQAYLDEFAFRFNRRNSATRGMLFYRLLEQAVATKPITYENLVVASRPKRTRPVPPTARRSGPVRARSPACRSTARGESPRAPREGGGGRGAAQRVRPAGARLLHCGKQNRIINVSVWLAAAQVTSIPVSCLELGRWNQGYAFNASRKVDYLLRARMSAQMSDVALREHDLAAAAPGDPHAARRSYAPTRALCGTRSPPRRPAPELTPRPRHSMTCTRARPRTSGLSCEPSRALPERRASRLGSAASSPPSSSSTRPRR